MLLDSIQGIGLVFLLRFNKTTLLLLWRSASEGLKQLCAPMVMIFDILKERFNTGLWKFICHDSHSHDLKLIFVILRINLLTHLCVLTFDPIFTLDSTFSLYYSLSFLLND